MPSSDGPLLRSSAQPSHCTHHTANAVNQSWNRVNDFGRIWSAGRVTGKCDGPGVWPGFCSFRTRFTVAFGKRIRHRGMCEIAVVLD